MTVTQLVKNDTAPRLNLTLKQGSSPIDLTDATVLFKFRKKGALKNVFSRPCTILDAVSGTCYYDWQSGDLAATGEYVGEIEITFPTGLIHTCTELLKFNIRNDL